MSNTITFMPHSEGEVCVDPATSVCSTTAEDYKAKAFDGLLSGLTAVSSDQEQIEQSLNIFKQTDDTKMHSMDKRMILCTAMWGLTLYRCMQGAGSSTCPKQIVLAPSCCHQN